jgi:hypothetical protein
MLEEEANEDLEDEDVQVNQVQQINKKGGKKVAKAKGKGHMVKMAASGGPTKCTRCGKMGHTAARCWVNQTCGKCGEKGHVHWQCKKWEENRAVPGGANKVQLANMFAAKIPKPSEKKG